MAKKTATKKRAAKKTAKVCCAGGGNRRANGTFLGPQKNTWKPGQSGNPNGRPRTTLLSTAYKKWLGTKCCDKAIIEDFGLDPKEEWTWADVISLGMVRSAIEGRTSAAKEIREATEGSTMAIKPDWQGVLSDMGIDPEEALKSLATELGSYTGVTGA